MSVIVTQHRQLAADQDRARRQDRPHGSAVHAPHLDLEAVDAAVANQPLDQALAIAQIEIGGADGVALWPDAQAEHLRGELVGEQDLRLTDARDHDRQRDPVGDGLQQLLALLELVLRRLARGDVAGQQNAAAGGNGAFAHPHPAPVRDAELPVLGRRAMVVEPTLDEVGAHVGVVHAARRGRLAHHVFEPLAELERGAQGWRGVVRIAAVEVDQTVIGIVDGEPVHQGLGGRHEAILAGLGFPLGGIGRVAGRAQLGRALGDPPLQQLVGPLQRLLGRLALGHVLQGADEARLPGRRIDHMVRRLVDHAHRAIGAMQAVLHGVAATGLGRAGARLLVARAIRGIDPLEPRRPGAQRAAHSATGEAMDARHLVGAPQAVTARQVDDEAAEPGQARHLAAQRRLLG